MLQKLLNVGPKQIMKCMEFLKFAKMRDGEIAY